MSLKEFYDWTDWNSRHVSPFKARFTHDEVIEDHRRMETQLHLKRDKDPNHHDKNNRDSSFFLPKSNYRILTIHTLHGLKAADADAYQNEWDRVHKEIVEKKMSVGEEMIRELELQCLKEHDAFVTCEWYYPLPPPFNQTQCQDAELEYVIPKIESVLNGTITNSTSFQH